MKKSKKSLIRVFTKNFLLQGMPRCRVMRFKLVNETDAEGDFGGYIPEKEEVAQVKDKSFPIVVFNDSPNFISEWRDSVTSKAGYVMDSTDTYGGRMMLSGKYAMVRGIQLHDGDYIEYPLGSGTTYRVGAASIKYESIFNLSAMLMELSGNKI